MPTRGTFSDLAAHWERTAAGIRTAEQEAARVAAPLVAETIRHTFGHAPPLADLAPATQLDRAEKGYAANDPLVREHNLQETWEPYVGPGPSGGVIGGAGSHAPLAAYHEFGFWNARANRAVPPRPAGRIGFNIAQSMAKRIWTNLVRRVAQGR